MGNRIDNQHDFLVFEGFCWRTDNDHHLTPQDPMPAPAKCRGEGVFSPGKARSASRGTARSPDRPADGMADAPHSSRDRILRTILRVGNFMSGFIFYRCGPSAFRISAPRNVGATQRTPPPPTGAKRIGARRCASGEARFLTRGYNPIPVAPGYEAVEGGLGRKRLFFSCSPTCRRVCRP